MENRQSFLQMMLEQLGILLKKKDVNIQATLSKINSEWIIDLNVQ